MIYVKMDLYDNKGNLFGRDLDGKSYLKIIYCEIRLKKTSIPIS